MAQRSLLSKLGTITGAAATQTTLTLPAVSVLPAASTGTSGVSLETLDGLAIVTTQSGAVAPTQGLTILGADQATVTPATLLVAFVVPAASATPVAYFVGPNMGGASQAAASPGGVNNAAIFLFPKMSFQMTPGAATTCTITVYGVRYV